MTGVQGEYICGVPSDTPPYPNWLGPGGPVWETPPPHKGCPPLPGLISEDSGLYLVISGRVLGAGNDLDQPLGPFCSPSRAGHSCDPRRG